MLIVFYRLLKNHYCFLISKGILLEQSKFQKNNLNNTKMSERSRWTSEVFDDLSSRSKDYRKSMRNSLGLEKRDYGVESPNE